MCRSTNEGGRRCPSCTPGTPKYEESRKLANKNRRESRAQRRAFANAVMDRYGDTDRGRQLAKETMQARPSDLASIAAYADQLDPELGESMRTAANEAVGGRHLPGVHNQNTMNDRHVSIKGDHYDSAWQHTQDTLRPDSESVNRVVGLTSTMTFAYLESDAADGLSEEKRKAFKDTAVMNEYLAESINPDGSFRSDPSRMPDNEKYTMLNTTPEDFMGLGMAEDAIAKSQRQSFLDNSTVIADVRPIKHERDLHGMKINNHTDVEGLGSQMAERGLDSIEIREGVSLHVNRDAEEKDEPPYYFQVDGDETLRLPAQDNMRVLSTTGRIPDIKDYATVQDTSLDDQHLSAERLTSPNTREGREFRKQLGREIIRASYTSGKDLGNDKRWETVTETDESGVTTTLDKLVKSPTPGKKGSNTATAIANLGLRKVAGDGGIAVESDKVSSATDSAMRASLTCQDRSGIQSLMEKTDFKAAGTDVNNGTTVRGSKRPVRDPKRTKTVAEAFTVSSDKDRRHHNAIRSNISGVLEAQKWDKQDGFIVEPKSPVANTFKGRVSDNTAVTRMVRSANRYDSERDRSSIDRKEAGDALLLERAIKKQREKAMIDDYNGTSKPSTMAMTMRVPKSTNHANVFHEGRSFSPSEHVIATPDGDPSVGGAYGSGEKEVRLVMSTRQGVAMNTDMSVVPKGSQFRVAKRMTDTDGTVTVFLVDENEVLDAAGVK